MKKLLIVVDFQNDFVVGSLGFENAQRICSNIMIKISRYHANKDDIVFTLDTHSNDYLNTLEGKKLPVIHCVKGTNGHELYPNIQCLVKDDDTLIEKDTFGSTKLADYIQSHSYESIELVGIVSNICVISNAIIAKTFAPQTEVIIDASCVASNDDKLNENALDIMENLQFTIINR